MNGKRGSIRLVRIGQPYRSAITQRPNPLLPANPNVRVSIRKQPKGGD